MNPLRSVRGRLALALLVVVAGALAIVYVVVVTTYKSSLIDAAAQPARARTCSSVISDTRADLPDAAVGGGRGEAARRRARRRLPAARRRAASCVPTRARRRDAARRRRRRRRLARQAVARYPLCTHEQPWRCMAKGTVTRNGELYAEVAYPLSQFVVVMLSSPLQERPHVGRASCGKRVLVAGALATVVRARARLRRSRRSSRGASAGSTRAAARIADGEFDAPIVDTDPDELGQLARTFDRMRVRLASLDRARAEFIANASHELRTPLFSLAGFLELLASEELDAETRADFMAAIREPGDAPDEARDRPARPVAARRRAADGRRSRASTWRRSASCSRPSSARASSTSGAHARRRVRGRRARARRRGARAADRPDPDRERDRAHAGRDDASACSRERGRARRRGWPWPTTGPGSSARRRRTSSTASTGSTARSPRAAASASRSRASSRR